MRTEKKLLKKEVLELIQTDADLQQEIKKLFQKMLLNAHNKDKLVTETYLDKQLAKLSAAFDEKLAKQSREFDEKLAKQSQEFREMLQQQSREFDEKLAKQSQEFREILQQQSREFDEKLAKQSREFDEKLLKLEERMMNSFDEKLEKWAKYFDSRLLELDDKWEKRMQAFGSRWGVQAEKSFANGLKQILKDIYPGKVEKWQYHGKIKEINPRREYYEIDVVLSDDKLILVEIKSSVREESIYNMLENVDAYEFITKQKADKKVLICNFIDKDAERLARKFDIFVETYL